MATCASRATKRCGASRCSSGQRKRTVRRGAIAWPCCRRTTISREPSSCRSRKRGSAVGPASRWNSRRGACAPIGGGRVWIIDRPKDQTPMAESRKLEDVLAELRKKRQRWLVWAKPGERPTLYDAASGMPAKRAMVRVAKADSKLHVVVGVVLDPYQIDADRDWAPPA